MARTFKKAVWSHPRQNYPGGKGDVGPMVQRLADAGFELIVPCLKVHGPVYYQSKIAHVDPAVADWDPLEELAKEAGEAGVKVHAWLCVFPEGEGSALIESRPHLAACDPEGKSQDWACPRSEEVQDYEFSLYEELMSYDVAGVHLDYIRYGGGDSCHCRRCRQAFSEQFGIDTSRLDWTDALWGDWLEFRKEPVTRFVRRMREATKSKGKELSAAVFPTYPSCLTSVGQDWVDWVENDLLDLLLPMNYTSSTEVARRTAQTHISFVGGRVPVYEGLGKDSHAAYIPTRNLAAQSEAVLDAGADGVCLFHYGAVTDEDLEALGKL